MCPLKRARGLNAVAEFLDPIPTGTTLGGVDALLNVGDWDRDGYGDFMTRSGTGALTLYRGIGNDQFAAPVQIGSGWDTVRLVAAVGDTTGDGWPDLMAQPKGGGGMVTYPGAGLAGFGTPFTAYSKIKAKRQVGVGRMDGDGAPDSIFRRRKNLVLYRGNGPGGLVAGSSKVRGRLRGFDWVIGISDIDLGGHADVLLRKKSNGRLYLLPGNERRFGKPVLLGKGMKRYDLAG